MSEYTTNGRPGGLAIIDTPVPEEVTPPAPQEEQVLILTCSTCRMVREHSLDEPIPFGCADPNCAGWTVTARLGTPASHPAWCDPTRCERTDIGDLMHYEDPVVFWRDAGSGDFELALGRVRYDVLKGDRQDAAPETLLLWYGEDERIDLTPRDARELAARLAELADHAERADIAVRDESGKWYVTDSGGIVLHRGEQDGGQR